MCFDRRVDPEFLALFKTDGVARSLVEYARHGARYAIDLNFRRNPKTDAQHATLYVGLTKVLDLHKARSDCFYLGGHWGAAKDDGWDPNWRTPASVADWRERWRSVESYLEKVIGPASESSNTEGPVQAAVAYFSTEEHVIIDREIVIAIRDSATREDIKQQLREPILKALQPLKHLPKWPPRLGNECDLLALDRTGQLVAIEVKPKNEPSITWVAAQVSMYATLLDRWLKEDPSASEVIKGMIADRQAIGLIAPPAFAVPAELVARSRAIVVLEGGTSPEYVRTVAEVRQHLLGITDIKVYQTNLVGRLNPVHV
jgi:hypothetical protein